MLFVAGTVSSDSDQSGAKSKTVSQENSSEDEEEEESEDDEIVIPQRNKVILTHFCIYGVVFMRISNCSVILQIFAWLTVNFPCSCSEADAVKLPHLP